VILGQNDQKPPLTNEGRKKLKEKNWGRQEVERRETWDIIFLKYYTIFKILYYLQS
jgi:hypothetical protein